MTADIQRFLKAQPFEPFSIVSSSGQRYRVPSAEHAGLNPTGSRVVVWFDDDSSVTLSGLHIASLETDAPSSRAA